MDRFRIHSHTSLLVSSILSESLSHAESVSSSLSVLYEFSTSLSDIALSESASVLILFIFTLKTVVGFHSTVFPSYIVRLKQLQPQPTGEWSIFLITLHFMKRPQRTFLWPCVPIGDWLDTSAPRGF
jgi:hypothetical protein